MASADYETSKLGDSKEKPPGGGTGGSRRKMWLRLSVLLLVVATPVALWQSWRPIDWLGLKKAYSIFEPTVVPAGSDLTYFEENIDAVAHSDKALWIGGDSGLLAHSEDEGKTWACLALANGSWQQNDCLVPRSKPSESVVAIQWFDGQKALLLTRAPNETPAAVAVATAIASPQIANQPAPNAPAQSLLSKPGTTLSTPSAAVQLSVRVSVYRTRNGGVSWAPFTAGETLEFGFPQFPLAGGAVALTSGTPSNATGGFAFLYPQSFPDCLSASSTFQAGNAASNALQQVSPMCVLRPDPLMRWFLKTGDTHPVVSVISQEYPTGRAITAAKPPARFSLRLPPPWYLFIALPLALVLLLLALREKTVVLPPLPDSIANMGVSDRPIDWDDADAMGFHAMARGISLFLRNANTGLPLVLAVNGRWGSGKSSLMNLLRANMRSSASTVWFNAWHHQSEEQLLAALLQAVRLQSLESMWSFEGMRRRGQLLLIRLKAIWPVATLLSGIGFLPLFFIAKIVQKLAQPGELDAIQATALFKHWVVLLSSVVALAGVLKKLKDSVGSLIANPASLLASSSGSVTLSDLNAQTTFRDRFSRDFKKLIDVLGDRRLVIIIDDLDRCRPEKLRDVLEAINFLVSSGNCAIILGLARLNVEHFLGYSFKDVVAKMPFQLLEVNPDNYTEDDKPRLYASLYLEKLIQIEVTVPPVTEAQARAMMVRETQSRRDDTKVDETFRRQRAKQLHMVEQLRTALSMADHWGMPIVGSLLLALALFIPLRSTKDFLIVQIGHLTTVEDRQKAPQGNPGPPVVGPAQPPVSGAKTKTSSENGSSPAANAADASTTGRQSTPSTTTVAPSQAGAVRVNPTPPAPLATTAQRAYAIPNWLILACECLLAVAFLLALLRLMLTKIESQVVHDSPEFERALDRWVPLIRGIFKSPRALKRYVNKVRFLAMRQRGMAEADPVPTIDRWAANLAKRLYPAPEPTVVVTTDPITIPDDVLILLVALEGDAIFWKLLTEKADQLASGQLDKIYKDRLSMESPAIYNQIYGAWPQLRVHLDRYLALAGRIVVT